MDLVADIFNMWLFFSIYFATVGRLESVVDLLFGTSLYRIFEKMIFAF